MMIQPFQTRNHGKVYPRKHICEMPTISRVPCKLVMPHVNDRRPDSGQIHQHIIVPQRNHAISHVNKNKKDMMRISVFCDPILNNGKLFWFDDDNKIKYMYSDNHQNEMGRFDTYLSHSPLYCMKDNWDNWLNLKPDICSPKGYTSEYEDPSNAWCLPEA